MRALIQRTDGVQLYIDNALYNATGKGLLVFFGTKTGDSENLVTRLAQKTTHLRIFEDDEGKMNSSCLDIGGEVMVVSQFTLYANTQKGHRPSFNEAMPPQQAEHLYDLFIEALSESGLTIKTGKFGASMDIRFNNAGPVTIVMDHD